MSKPHYRLRADGTAIQLHDGYRNVVANVGTGRDKSAFGRYQVNQWTDANLDAAYRSSWLARKIIDTIPEDATSKWRAWQADSDQISKIEAEEKRLRLSIRVKEAMISARLFGSSAIYASFGDSDVSKPVSVDTIRAGEIRHLTVLGKNQIQPGDTDTDPDSEWFGQPGYYVMQTDKAELKIHPSRLSIFHGATRPVGSMTTGYHMSPKAVGGGAYFSGHGYWSDSVIQIVHDALKNADSTSANIASLIFEANVDVLHIPRLMELLGQPDGETRVNRYLTSVATSKGINGMMVLDGGDTSQPEGNTGGTKYERKGAQFTGLADLWDRFMIAVSGASDIPATYLFGMSPSGQNSTGESDMRNYAKRIDTMQRMEMEPAMSVLDECIIRSALGNRPDDVHYNWRPSFEASEKEKADVAKVLADVISSLSATQLFPVEVLQDTAANAMIESGALPGLEAAIKEYMPKGPKPPPGDDDERAALGLPPEE